jgi:uncharacterized protein YoxC
MFSMNFFAQFLVALIAVLAMPAHANNSVTKTVDELTAQWLVIENQTRQLNSDWRARQPILEQRLKLLKAQREQLLELVSETKILNDDVGDKREELLSRQNVLESNQALINAAVNRISEQLAFVEKAVPPPVMDIWQNKLGSSGEQNLGASISSSQTQDSFENDSPSNLQLSLQKLSTLREFSRTPLAKNSLIVLTSGETIAASQFYFGSGIAWFVSPDKSRAGMGRVNNNKWQWSLIDAKYADNIDAAIQMLNNKQLADYVVLPIVLAKSAPALQE